ncbi:Gfo/Idh/MocA family oxidoreductase [Candidatus Omnitrophota bacterium]
MNKPNKKLMENLVLAGMKDKTQCETRIAVIGAGYWGKNLVRNFIDLGVLNTICDSSPNVLKQYSDKYREIELSGSFKEVLSDKGITGVVIATPAVTHYKLAKQALIAGKHVFIEKPIALAIADANELIALANKNKAILMVGHILEYHPAVLKLKELVDNGELGKVNYIYSNRLNLGKVRNEENILWSFAPHDISVIRLLLGEEPYEVTSVGGDYLNPKIADVTISTLSFNSGAKAHIFVSWLHPFKEQRLIVIGDKKMAVFEDSAKDKLKIYDQGFEWKNHVLVPRKNGVTIVDLESTEPLRAECKHFIECIEKGNIPKTNGESGVKVLQILKACQQSLENNGMPVNLFKEQKPYFAHHTTTVDKPCRIGEGTNVWHYSHVMKGAKIGKNCSIGQNVNVSSGALVGNNVKIQNNVSLYDGVIIEDDVFCGPSCVFTNVINPRSFISRKKEFKKTIVKKGATIGANATIICGNTIGKYGFIGAGAVVTKDVPDYAIAVGNPARIKGWMCECGVKLNLDGTKAKCFACKKEYMKNDNIVKRYPVSKQDKRAVLKNE